MINLLSDGYGQQTESFVWNKNKRNDCINKPLTSSNRQVHIIQ